MSTNKKYKQFLSELKVTIACPYCGEDNQLDPPRPCCGEVHAQAFYNIDGELLEEKDLAPYFADWLESEGLRFEFEGEADLYDSIRDSELDKS